MCFVSKVKREVKFFRRYGLIGIACHYFNPQRLRGSAYRFPKESPEREKRLKLISRYDKVYSRTAKVLLGANVVFCAICIKISMASPLK